MGPEQFQSLNKIICVLCEKSDESETTGPLSSKESTSAHENCLLFASGIYSKNSPTYDDLFGFAVEDVKEEQRRGKRLVNIIATAYAQHTLTASKTSNISKIYTSAYDSLVRWAEVETPRRKKIKRILDSDDESPTSTDRVVAPAMSNTKESMLPKQPSQSSPVPEKTRPCEKLNPSTTEADDDDTDIDSDDSQSLLQPEMYHITVPCSILMDSGPSAESEYSLEPSSPAGAAPAAMCTSPGSVAAPELEETPSTSRTSPPPRAQTTDPTPNQDRASDGPTGQPGSPPHSSPTVDVLAVSISAVQTLSLLVQASHLKSEQLPEPSPPAGVSSSPGRPAAADASDVGTTEKSQSSAAIFWTRCNEAGWTKEVFSELVSQLSSLGERVLSQEACHQDYDVALKVLLASGQLPCIFTQLEQDLEKQERDLQRKKAALRDAKAVLDV
ncbi:uncharacterized protein [Sinocyclocheilus grahami]|uniref:uncharacterized protein n=1 Tax=Sinocyclocheilus grahami TaxID=75366 RepID=UPI0007AD0E1A|nr:PREDICTED: uncharacterized protein LOC107600412 [Sinocyclocheilus grahami]